MARRRPTTQRASCFNDTGIGWRPVDARKRSSDVGTESSSSSSIWERTAAKVSDGRTLTAPMTLDPPSCTSTTRLSRTLLSTPLRACLPTERFLPRGIVPGPSDTPLVRETAFPCELWRRCS